VTFFAPAPTMPGLDRVAARPRPEDWAEDDPLRLEEAVAIFAGRLPITVALLRNEIAKGRLVPAKVAGKYFVTPLQLRELFRPCPAPPKVPGSICARPAAIRAPAAPCPTPISSVTARLNLARAAVLASSRRPKPNSSTT
jgi:hypothetical protein